MRIDHVFRSLSLKRAAMASGPDAVPLPAVRDMLARLEAAYAAFQEHGETARAEAEACAEAAHELAISNYYEGRPHDAIALLEQMQFYADHVYVDDPQSRWTIYNDLGALYAEVGRRSDSIGLLSLAWTELHDWRLKELARGRNATPDVDLCQVGTAATLLGLLALKRDVTQGRIVADAAMPLRHAVTDENAEKVIHFDGSLALWLASIGESEDSEIILTTLETRTDTRPGVRQLLSRIALARASAFADRKRYRRAFDMLGRAREQCDADRFPQDAADIEGTEAAIWFKLGRSQVGGKAWKNAHRQLRLSRTLRSRAPVVSPSQGCAEDHIEALTALHEGRVKHARALLTSSMKRAATVWTLGDSLVQNQVLAGAAILIAEGDFPSALDLTTRVIEKVRQSTTTNWTVLLEALSIRAEAFRRMDLPHEAAAVLEHAVGVEAEFLAASVAPSWTPQDAVLARRGHESLNALVDALMAMPGQSSVERLFCAIARSKDLAVRTLRAARGAQPPKLKLSTLVADVASALPPDSSYVEFFVRLPRVATRTQVKWGAPELIAFTLEAGNPASLRMHRLGPAKRLVRLVQDLPERRRSPKAMIALFKRIGDKLAPVMLRAQTKWVFIAPDGDLHALPFGAVRLGGVPWLRTSAIGLVESAAALAESRVREGPSGVQGRVICAAKVGSPFAGGGGYLELPFACEEAEAVATELKVSADHLPSSVGAAALVRSMLDNQAGVPNILHYAGHADVFRDRRQAPSDWQADRYLETISSDDDFSRSRIILGGFNDWASGRVACSIDDVSISAKDFAAFPLISLRLLTFGACSGAAGATQVLESSASLATAARVAGAGAVAATLWPVRDRATFELMSSMYGHFTRYRSAIAALADAQRQMDPDDPAAWAGFVVWAGPDDLRPLSGRTDY